MSGNGYNPHTVGYMKTDTFSNNAFNYKQGFAYLNNLAQQRYWGNIATEIEDQFDSRPFIPMIRGELRVIMPCGRPDDAGSVWMPPPPIIK